MPRHTGAYYVKDGDINKGVSIKLTRAKDWWAKDKKYYRHRFNPDHIVYTVIRDENKAFELFRAGQLEAFFLTRPSTWYEKSEILRCLMATSSATSSTLSTRGCHVAFIMNVSRPKLDDGCQAGSAARAELAKVIDVMFPWGFLPPAGI